MPAPSPRNSQPRRACKWQLQTASPGPKVNHIGLPVLEYRGGKSTLCAGCGHNAISERIIDAMFEMGVEPERVMKMSGIGCSSKSPAYFMSRSHSFNSVHGRMPSVSTGAHLANHTNVLLGVSGDGDTASIGMGQFVHLMRRNLPMIYIIEDNGVYGLTKGQFSATADIGSKLKTGVINDLPAIDTCALAIQLGATFVGRSFSGDKKQLLSMLKAAIAHKGTVMLDVISPCVTFNDHEGSTKSYKFMQEIDEPINEVGFVASFDDIEVDYDSGQVYDVEMHDGSSLRLRKLHEDYDPTDKANAVRTLMEAEEKNEVLTGVLYINTEKPTFTDLLSMVDEPLGNFAGITDTAAEVCARCADGKPSVRECAANNEKPRAMRGFHFVGSLGRLVFYKSPAQPGIASLLLHSGGAMNAHGGKLCFRLRCLRRLRVPLDQQAKLVDACIPLALLDQRKALVQLRGGSLWASTETFEHRVVILDRFCVILLMIGYFTKVILRASGKIIHRVVVNYILKFAGGDCVLCRVIVAQARLKGLLQRGSHTAGRCITRHWLW